MSIRRITISVPEALADRIREAAGEEPVSTWVAGLVEERLDDVELERQWEEFCRDVKPSAAESRRAQALFGRLTRRRRSRRAA